MIPMMILCSCSSIKKEDNDYSDEESRQLLEEALQEIPIEVLPYEEELKPLELLDNIEQESTESLVKFHEGDNDQYVYVVGTDYIEAEAPYSSSGSYDPTSTDVTLVDENDNEIPMTLINSSNGKATFKVPVSTFEEKHGYHVKLNSDVVKFCSKEPTIRQITYYSLDINDSNRARDVVKNTGIKSFDINKVQYFDVDALSAYFIFDEYLDIDPSRQDDTGLKFRIADLTKDQDDEETVYGKLISCQKNPNGAGYLVRYEACKGSDIYSTLNVNDSVPVNENTCSNITIFDDEETIENQLGKAFLAHPDIVTAMSGMMNYFEVTPDDYLQASKYEWASRLNIKFTAGFDGNTDTFNWGFDASLNFTPKDDIAVTLHVKYHQTIRYTVSASLSIETWLFIPTGVNYRLEVKEDDSKEVEVGINISTNLAPYDEEAVQQGIENDLIDAFTKNKDVKSKFMGDPSTTTADGKSYPLLRFDCYYFFPLDIRFEIDFYWKLQLSIEATVKYSSHTQRVDVSLSNNKGCDPHSETAAISDKSVTINFMGSFHAEIGLRASLGLGIIGLYKFFHAEVFITAYGAVDAQGFILVGVAWGDNREASITGTMGGKFEVSVGVKWGVDINLLFGGFNKEWPIVKAILLGFAHDSAINNFIESESTIEITDQDYGHYINLDEYHVLGAATFDAKNFGSAFLDMKHDDAADTRYGAWLSPAKAKYFTFELTKGSEYIDFNDYKINIKSVYAIEEFEAEIKVTVNPSLTVTGDVKHQTLEKTIKIHFTNNLKKQINIINLDGEVESIGSYVIGIGAKLPVPNAPRYQKFAGWREVGTENIIPYDEDDPTTGIYTPQETGEITFEYVFEDYYTWTVIWLDGFGNVIKTEQVFYNESAIEPTAEERDQYMISYDPDCYYEFIGYDTDYTCITGNTVIRAMYEYKRK